MNITEAKALFFAQYLWQNVGYGIDHLMVNRLTLNSNAAGKLKLSSVDKNCALLLRSVSQLTDEETKEVCQVFNYSLGYQTLVIDAEIDNETGTLTFWYHEADDRRCSYVEFEHLPQACTDYLKLKGIILSFTYLNEENKPITLQPDEIIKLGWAKYQ
jgi:hypothetical protein